MNGPARLALCWPLAEWPDADRWAWVAATTPIALLSYRRRFGTKLGSESVRKIAKGYGRWLSFLHKRYESALTETMADRVTVPRLRAYFRALQQAGNAPGTVAGRFYELQAALRLIAPDFDGSVIRHLDGATMRQRLDLTPRPVFVPSIEVLMDWGFELMQRGGRQASPELRDIDYRDGLLVTMLAARGRRRRSMSAIRVGHELTLQGDFYVVALSADQVKTAKPDTFHLPRELTPYIHHYLQETRPALLGTRADHCALWMTGRGTPMKPNYLTNRMLIITRKRFGLAFGPHRFRHAISTALAYHAPKATGLAAAVLAISPNVVACHYDRANQVSARRMFSSVVARRKARTD